MVRWDNSLSLAFRCSNVIRQGGQLSPLLYNVYTDDLNHHLEATGVEFYVGGACLNSLSYADDIVLLTPTVTALQTLSEVCHAYAGPHEIVYNTTKTVSYSDTFKRLINVQRYTSSSLAFAMNATGFINVVLHKFAYSLMSRVVASPTVLLLSLSIAMHIISLH